MNFVYYPDVAVSTDQTHPSWSANEITLTVRNGTQLFVQVPWSFLAEGIKTSLNREDDNRPYMRVVMNKSLNYAWPKEFGGRSKWDPDRLKHWKDLASNGTLKMHIEAQFDCDSLKLDAGVRRKSRTPLLDEVREIVRTLFYSHCNNAFYLFAICDKSKPNVPVFHLRVHPPVRFTPQGSPLLLVSVINHQLASRFIQQGQLDPQENQFEFHRIITERVSREVCIIRVSSDELDLFSYVLRVNSTKMRRGAWQSKNLLRGDNTPWMPTFVSPLYVEDMINICNRILAGTDFAAINAVRSAMQFRCAEFSLEHEFPICCTNPLCSMKKIDMKKCSGCKFASYCSVACQKTHWPKHKSACSFTNFAKNI